MNSPIPIVFAFDNNFAKPAFIAISSLIHYANNDTKYKIYCIISNDVNQHNINEISQLNNKQTQIEFIIADIEFNDAYQHRKITTAAYYRLMTHKLIPNENKIIYVDVDVLFKGDLSNVYNTKLGENIIGGVKNLFIHQVFEKHIENIPYWKKTFGDSKYTYINSGFLIMNLTEIRKTEIWKKWIKLSSQPWEYHDQDILCMTCKEKITYLAPKYNSTYAIRAKEAINWDLFTKEELSQKPVVLHYTAGKPWNSKYMKQADEWWYFVENHTDLYSYFLSNYKKNYKLHHKIKRLTNRVINKIKRLINRVINKINILIIIFATTSIHNW